MSVRLYGRTRGESSHARVTAGFRAALEAVQKLSGLVGLDDDQLDDEDLPPGAAAPHGVLTGDLRMSGRLLENAQHARRWAVVAPNSTRLPDALLGQLMMNCTDLIAPSEWAYDVITEEQARLVKAHEKLSCRPQHVVPHGLSQSFRANAAARAALVNDFEQGMWRVLHFSTSERDRKGTIELLLAWEYLVLAERIPRRAELFLVLDPPAYTRIVEWMADRGASVRQVNFVGRMNASPAALADTLAQIHLVCQPSRGEAFGLFPLESLACGVPIAATRCTGHREWFKAQLAGAVEIQTGPLADIDDVPGGRAPSVEPDAVSDALSQAHEQWPELAANALDNAENVRTEWSWDNQLARWMKELGVVRDGN